MASLDDPAERDGVPRRDVGRILGFGLLAPDIVDAILKGHQPKSLSYRYLKRLSDLPISWKGQREFLGFPG